MIFLTVGTQFPFDRLVYAVDNIIDDGFIKEEIFAQIGESSYKPRNFKSVTSLDKNLFDSWMQKASGIISHAGMGVITMALDNRKPLLVMPRLRKYREVVHDHQVAIAQRFEQLGHLLAAYSEDELPNKLQQLKTFVPLKRENQAKAVADRIADFLKSLTNKTK
jgi:UDP-N-acetylglucosamine transferase subunit ALG13